MEWSFQHHQHVVIAVVAVIAAGAAAVEQHLFQARAIQRLEFVFEAGQDRIVGEALIHGASIAENAPPPEHGQSPPVSVRKFRIKAMPAIPDSAPETAPQLAIATDKVGFIILKARAFDAKEGLADDDSGSNPTDDGDTDVLEDTPDDLTRLELADAIRGLNEEEQINLVALAWVGRGTYEISEWDQALETARSEHNRRTAQYLLGLPLLGDYLEEGLAAFGETISDEDAVE